METAGESVPHSRGTGEKLEPESWSSHCCNMTCDGEQGTDILPAAILAQLVLPA
jgi:hypothetical protein